jgi:drug/metabolite transporter (DMT)-like permease
MEAAAQTRGRGPREHGHRWIGPLAAVLGVLGFSFKAILVKLAYAWHPIDAVTLLALRMLFSAPFFVAMAWWAGRRPEARPIARRDWRALIWLGFVGYYLSSLLDFTGLVYITAALERLVLFMYPTMVVLLSAVMLGRPVTRRAVLGLVVSYAGIAFVVGHDLRFGGDASALWTGVALVFGSAFAYALYLVGAGDVIARMGSMRFIAWAMLASTVFVLTQFALTRDLASLRVPPSIYALSLGMAVFSTVLPTWLVAEAVRRMGANASSLVGSLGPVFTIGLGALILGEAVHWIQLVGAALVLVGVMLVTLRPVRARDGTPGASTPGASATGASATGARATVPDA